MLKEKKKITVQGLGEITDNGNGTFTMSTALLRHHQMAYSMKPVDPNVPIGNSARFDLVRAGMLFLVEQTLLLKRKVSIRFGRGKESFVLTINISNKTAPVVP